jgi:hypothetical protein
LVVLEMELLRTASEEMLLERLDAQFEVAVSTRIAPSNATASSRESGVGMGVQATPEQQRV